MFTFKLQPALNYRKSIEEKKLVDFSDGKKLLEKEIERLEAIQNERAELLGHLKKTRQPLSAERRMRRQSSDLRGAINEKVHDSFANLCCASFYCQDCRAGRGS